LRFHGDTVDVDDNGVVVYRSQGEIGEDGGIGDIDDAAEVGGGISLVPAGSGIDVDESDDGGLVAIAVAERGRAGRPSGIIEAGRLPGGSLIAAVG